MEQIIFDEGYLQYSRSIRIGAVKKEERIGMNMQYKLFDEEDDMQELLNLLNENSFLKQTM